MKKGETLTNLQKKLGSGFDGVTLATTTNQNLSVIIVSRKWGRNQLLSVAAGIYKQFLAVKFLEEEAAVASLCTHWSTWTRGKLRQF